MPGKAGKDKEQFPPQEESDEDSCHPPSTTRTPASSPYPYPSYDDDDDDEDDDEDDDDGNLLEIVIETLTGTTFQVRVSPWETGAGLKSLLQRTQGLPSSHQHILLGQTELTDESPLIDQGVQDGALLKLVLAMKGGPMNSGRIPPYDESLWNDFTTFMDVNREELWDSEQGHPVTLLVLREGDAVNLYRVIENNDGTFSPLNESWSSRRSAGSGKTDVSSRDSMLEETMKHQQKMVELNARMEAMKVRNKRRKDKKKGSSKPSSPKMKLPLGSRLRRNRESLSQSQKVTREPSMAGQNPGMKTKATKSAGRVLRDASNKKPSAVHSTRLPPVLSTPRRSIDRYLPTEPHRETPGSTPRPSISRGSRILDELPKRPQPRHVEFSHHPKLESIRPQREKRGSLTTLKEDSYNHSTPPEENQKQERPQKHFNSYRKALVRHGKRNDLREEVEDGEDPPAASRHAWSGRDAPFPLYIDPGPRPKPRHKQRLNQSHNVGSLHPPKEFDDRPKTSPEILEHRPGSAATSSTMSDRIHLRAPDDKLKELITILNISRASSRMSDQSDPPIPPLGHQRKSSFQDPPSKWRSNRQSIQFSGNTSLSTSFKSIKGSTPPSDPSTSRSRTGFQQLGSQEQIDALRDALKSQQPPISRRSTPDVGKTVTRRPGSGQFKAVTTPRTLISATPKRKVKKIRTRCQKCQKKLGLSTSYSCRCGHVFCAQHRYAETHECSYDYKQAGKKLIEIANPLVVPPKLPKI